MKLNNITTSSRANIESFELLECALHEIKSFCQMGNCTQMILRYVKLVVSDCSHGYQFLTSSECDIGHVSW